MIVRTASRLALLKDIYELPMNVDELPTAKVYRIHNGQHLKPSRSQDLTYGHGGDVLVGLRGKAASMSVGGRKSTPKLNMESRGSAGQEDQEILSQLCRTAGCSSFICCGSA